MSSGPLTPAALAEADCVAILTRHRSLDYDMVQRSAPLIVDTRNAISGSHAHVIKLGAPAPRFERNVPAHGASIEPLSATTAEAAVKPLDIAPQDQIVP